MKRLIIFLIRTRLGLRKGEIFQFTNQKTNDIYWFSNDALMKEERGNIRKSTTSMNWLLDGECYIRKVVYDENTKVYRERTDS